MNKRGLRAWDGKRLGWPTDWTAVFGREAPLWIEIGFGDAEFLIDQARHRPDVNLIGVEISLPSIKKAESKGGRLPTPNLQLVHGDARVVLQGAVPAGALAQVFINFPDPWHKAAHHHRKLINDEFLGLLASRMTAGAQLDIATDDPGYQEQIIEVLERTPYFHSRLPDTFTADDPTRLVTKYEKKARREGRTPLYFKWQCHAHPADPAEFAPPQEFEMPHAVIDSSLTLDQIAQQFAPQRYGGDPPVRLLNLFKGVDPGGTLDEMLLIETHVAEEPLPQRLALFVQQRQGAEDRPELLIGIHELGFPRPTAGTHLAVSHLAGWLLSLDPGMILLRHNLARTDGLPQIA